MQTTHRFIYEDSRAMNLITCGAIDLVITSPPYPMIEMWDRQFAKLNPKIDRFLQDDDYCGAFEAMHLELDKVWEELYRVMKEGALACINIGDAARTINRRFRLFANHARVQKKFADLGFDLLPLILWRKPTNAPNKFMGSGMLPGGAYVTLEHEYILLFRKQGRRLFTSAADKMNRRQSAYFWEERNTWFSDLWNFQGTRQANNRYGMRARSGAFPFELPFRLVNMYSVFGDTVLDPFSGTGTTALAAMAAGRNSINLEVDSAYSGPVKERIFKEFATLEGHNRLRIGKHLEFVRTFLNKKNGLKYNNSHYGFPVMTGQEQDLKLAFAGTLEETEEGCLRVTYLDGRQVAGQGDDRLC